MPKANEGEANEYNSLDQEIKLDEYNDDEIESAEL